MHLIGNQAVPKTFLWNVNHIKLSQLGSFEMKEGRDLQENVSTFQCWHFNLCALAQFCQNVEYYSNKMHRTMGGKKISVLFKVRECLQLVDRHSLPL